MAKEILNKTEAEILMETDAKFSKSESAFLKEIITKYYRQPIPFDLEVYRHFAEQPVELRTQIQNDPFWQSIGRFIPLLDFSEKERLKFARESECEKLLLFLLFEKDLTVLEAVFNNPRLPTKVLFDYINLIKERDIEREDDKIVRMAQAILKRRSRRIIRAQEIRTILSGEMDEEKVLTLLVFLTDKDPHIRESASNAVSMVSLEAVDAVIKNDEAVTRLRERFPKMSGIEYFEMLRTATRLVLSVQATNQMMESGSADVSHLEIDLRKAMKSRKLKLLTASEEDPSDFFNLSVLATMHVDIDPELRGKASEILSLEDLFDLIGDESTPRRIASDILQLLERHSDRQIKSRAEEIRLLETERLNKKMKEIEVSVNAYFDVIFQSLGYARINDQKDAVQVLKTSINYLQQFRAETKNADDKTLGAATDLINQALTHFQSSINSLYTDTKKEVFSELEEIQGMVKHILDLKHFKFDEESDDPDEEMDEMILNKAVMIWRTAISQFLGRVKDFEEMLKLKWIKLVPEVDKTRNPEMIEEELQEAFTEIEVHHKGAVDCKLKIQCRDCKRRGCASERFLLQVDFLLDEITDNFDKLKK